MVTSWKREDVGNMYDFVVQITLSNVDDGMHWVAIGFSRDFGMGDDAVVMSSEVHGAKPFWNIDWGFDADGEPVRISVEVEVCALQNSTSVSQSVKQKLI
jgi:hypothetical protein